MAERFVVTLLALLLLSGAGAAPQDTTIRSSRNAMSVWKELKQKLPDSTRQKALAAARELAPSLARRQTITPATVDRVSAARFPDGKLSPDVTRFLVIMTAFDETNADLEWLRRPSRRRTGVPEEPLKLKTTALQRRSPGDHRQLFLPLATDSGGIDDQKIDSEKAKQGQDALDAIAQENREIAEQAKRVLAELIRGFEEHIDLLIGALQKALLL